MRANKSRDTTPELRVRRILHASGIRYRVNYLVPGMPRRTIDIAFPSRRLAVFIDGCYWHGCTEHRGIPTTNRQFWQQKIGKNRERDHETDAHLRSLEWVSLRFWEHESLDRVVSTIVGLVNGGSIPPGAATRQLTEAIPTIIG
jgi:DNA mismatch endonuclease (patch repair protein)